MLIDFTVGNYRSIKEPVTLSAIAAGNSPGKARQGSGKRRSVKTDTQIAPPYGVPARGFALLPVLGIFGANASGKTNLLRAMDGLLWLMTHEVASSEQVIPFGFDPRSAISPSDFRLRLALDGGIYTYFLQVDRRQVYRETLENLPGGSSEPALLFNREAQADTGRHCWQAREAVEAVVGMLPTIPADQTLMSLLVRSEPHSLLVPLVKWLTESVRGISLGYNDMEREIAGYWAGAQELSRTAILQLLRNFDLSIVDLIVQRKPPGKGSIGEVIVYHATPQGRVAWPLEYESLGTQRLFELAPKLLWTLHYGKLALFDELGTNLHPYVTERVVRLFQNPETNPKHAQLVFTSHDNTLLQNQLLRRDQVLFTEKRSDGSTDLYSASDFRARNDLALDKAYLDGRFGAVPILPDEAEMLAGAGRRE